MQAKQLFVAFTPSSYMCISSTGPFLEIRAKYTHTDCNRSSGYADTGPARGLYFLYKDVNCISFVLGYIVKMHLGLILTVLDERQEVNTNSGGTEFTNTNFWCM